MIVRPKSPPTIVVELSSEEAAAIGRAIERAIAPIRAAGNTLDIQRLGALRDGIDFALRGSVHHEQVEP
jgi:hypothetical protein